MLLEQLIIKFNVCSLLCFIIFKIHFGNALLRVEFSYFQFQY